MVKAQGGNLKQIENPDLLPTAPIIRVIPSPYSGVISGLDAREVGLTALELGAVVQKRVIPLTMLLG